MAARRRGKQTRPQAGVGTLFLDVQAWWLLGLAAVLLFAGIGLRDPWPPDEPRLVLIGWEIANLGHWLIPTVAGTPYGYEPPLYTWTLGLLFKLTGSVGATFLIPSFLAGMAILVLLADLATRLWGRRVGLATGYLLLVTFQFCAQVKTAQSAAFLTLLTTLALYGVIRHVVIGPNWRWWYIGCLAFGLALLTSGHAVVLLFLLLPCFLARALTWKMPVFEGGLKWLWGVLIMLAPPAAWLGPIVLNAASPEDLSWLWENLLFGSIASYADPSAESNRPWYYLTNVILPLWLPLPLLLPWLVPRWLKGIRQKDTRLLILLGWLFLGILFFSALPAKDAANLLPLLPAAVLASAPAVPELVRQPRCSLVLLVLATLVVLLLAVPVFYLIAVDPGTANELLGKYDLPQNSLWVIVITVIVSTIVLIIFRQHGERALLVVVAICWMVYGLVAGPMLNELRSGSRVMNSAAALLNDDNTLGLVGWKEQLFLHRDRPVVHFGVRRRDPTQELYDAAAWLSEDPRRRLLLPMSLKERCFDGPGSQLLSFAHRTYWHLVGPGDTDSRCATRGNPRRAFQYPPP